MNRFYTRQSLIAGVIISFTLVSFFAWYSYISMNKARKAALKVNATLLSLRSLENLMDDMQDIETSNRGYIISGNKEFLTSCYKAINKLNIDSAEVIRLNELYPERKDTINRLLSLVRRKIDISLYTETLMSSRHGDSALLIMKSGEGKVVMDSIRQIVRMMENQDRIILESSNTNRELAATTTTRLFVILALIFLIVAFLFFLLLRREFKRKEKYEAKISFLANLAEQTSDAIISVNLQLEVVSWNKGAENIYGYTEEEVVGKAITEITSSETLKSETDQIKKEIFSKGFSEFESLDFTKDGRSIHCLTSASSLANKKGEVTGYVFVVRDITQRKLAEKLMHEFNLELADKVKDKTEDIRKSEEKLRQVLDSAAGEFYVIDLEYRVILISKMAELSIEKAWGKKVKTGDIILQHIPLDRRVVIKENYDRVFTGQRIEYETPVQGIDGRTWVHIAYTPVMGIYDEITGAFIGTKNITERKKAEAELQESETRYRTLIEQATDCIVVTDPEGKFLQVNERGVKLFGYNRDEFLQFYLNDILLIKPGDIPLRFEELRSGKGILSYRKGKKKDGTLVELEISTKMLSNGNFIGIARDISERVEAQKALMESENRFRAIFNTQLQMVCLLDRTGKVLEVNKTALDITGYRNENLKGKYFWDIQFWQKEEERLERILRLKAAIKRAANGEFIRYETMMALSGKAVEIVDFSIKPVPDAEGNNQLLLIEARLITEIKKAENELRESEAKYRAFFENSLDGILLTSPDGTILSANPAACDMFGMTENEIISAGRFGLIDKADTEVTALVEERRLKGKASGELTFIRKNGDRFPGEVSSAVFIDGYGRERTSMIIRDITERKKAEDKIRNSNNRFEMISHTTNDAIWEWNIETGELWANETHQKLYGLKADDPVPSEKIWRQRIHPDDRNIIVKRQEASLVSDTNVFISEYRFLGNHGEYVYLFDRCYIQRNSEGKAVRMTGSMMDITPRKTSELQLKESEERLRLSLEATKLGLYDLNIQSGEAIVNEQYARMLGYNPEEFSETNSTWLERLHPDDLAAAQKTFQDYITGEIPEYKIEFREKTRDGDWKWILSHGKIVEYDVSGKPLRMLGTHTDVTSIRMAEEELVKSNKRFNMVSRATSDIVWDWDILNDSLWWNDNYYQNLGYKKEKDTVHINDWYDRIHPDERERVRRNAAAAFSGQGAVWRDEYRYQKSDGTYLHFLDRGLIMRDENGRAVKMIGSMVDMTPVYSVQREIKESEMRLRTILDTDPECIKLIDKDARLLDINKAGLAMLEVNGQEEVRGGNLMLVVADKYKKQLGKILKDAFLGKSGRAEFEMNTFKGTHRWCEIFIVPFRNTEGEVVSALGVTRDITERRKSEEELRKSKETRELIMNSALDGIIAVSFDQRIISWNPQAEGIFGWKESEVTGRLLHEVVIPERLREKHLSGIAGFLKKGDSPVLNKLIEVKGLHASGREFDLELIIRVIKSEEGEFLCTFVRDITERKSAELALRLSEEKYRTLIEQAADAIALYDEKGRVLEANSSASKLLGYSKEELAKMFLSEILHEDEIRENPIQYDVLNAGVSTVKIRRMKRKDGSVVITEVRSQQLPDGRFLSVVRDMTERLKAEEELKASYKAIRKLTAYLQNIREEERTNIAREIHDELGQQLTVLKMDVAWLNKKFQGTDEKVNQRLKDLLIMLDETVKSVRRISSQLRPSLLDDLGLIAAIEWQLNEFEKRAGIKTKFVAPQEEVVLPVSSKTALFRIFQESLTNVARHSQAKKLSVELRRENQSIIMSIIDNGKGFDKKRIAEKKTLGILGMKERCEMIGGTYEISSAAGEGTAVVVSVPFGEIKVK